MTNSPSISDNKSIEKKTMPKLWTCFMSEDNEEQQRVEYEKKINKKINKKLKQDAKVYKATYRLLLLGQLNKTVFLIVLIVLNICF